jgi:hypothetical protein
LEKGPDNLGEVTIKRQTGSAGVQTFGSASGIKATWTLTFPNAVNSGRNFSFMWMPAFDNGKTISSASLWKKSNGDGTWSNVIPSFDASGRTVSFNYMNTSAGTVSYTVSDQGNALPVELTAFSAENSADKVKLKWKTATEINNYGFDVERKLLKEKETDSGNIGWKKIGFAAGSGNANSARDYSFSDNAPAAGTLLYRLKQMDINGAFKYSETVSLKCAIPSAYGLMQNYPNPFNPSTLISYQLPAASFVKIKIFDMLGREIRTLVNDYVEAGSSTVEWDGSDNNGSRVSSGIYIYNIKAGSFSAARKMNLLK